jgi:preprotein translocase subunit SecG
MIYYVLVAFHVVVCLFLVIVVLLQSGKAADLAGAFGGMGSQTAFGPRGSATILSKATTIAAAIFMVTSMALAILATRGYEGRATVFDRTAPSRTSQPLKQQPGRRAAPTTSGGGKSIPMPMPPRPAPAPAKK